MGESWTKISSSLDIIPESEAVLAEGENCPPATLDIELNLENRKKAIDSAMYGPLNPAEPNDEYWNEIASEWQVDADTARQQICGNCAMFNISSSMKGCIAEGVGPDRFDLVDAAGELGYCEAFDFKCASARTCRAWVGGGPITEDSQDNEAASKMEGEDPCWEGYVMVGMKKKGNKLVPNCVPKDSSTAKQYAAKQALFDDSEPGQVYFGAREESLIESRVDKYNENCPSNKKVTLAAARAVYRRGALSLTSSASSYTSRHSLGMNRLEAFLKLMRTGKPSYSSYVQDNDLLPPHHPLHRSEVLTVTASGSQIRNSDDFDGYVQSQTLSDIKSNPQHYDSISDAIVAITECSGMGYEFETNVRAVWMRAVEEGDSPFNRARSFAVDGEFSQDYDLLPGSGLS